MTVSFTRLLIANRGEIAIRITRAAAGLDLPSLAVYAEDDAASLHVRQADNAIPLRGRGVPAYLDGEQLIAIARAEGCDALHPGYGFLAENAAFARNCEAAGLRFIGPGADVLELFGDKTQARALAERCEVPLLKGLNHAVTLEEARDFLASLGPGGALMLKALHGGGGRGMREVFAASELAEAYTRCQSEARAAFGRGEVYVEQLMRSARHIEVQVLGDGSGAVSHLWERECSLQRSHQKLVEIAPSPGLLPATRERIIAAALKLAGAVKYSGLGTFEFLLDNEQPGVFCFMEANPRIQVEHTVTEQITGVDLVQTQILLAADHTLADLKLSQAPPPPPKGCAVQLRINLESMNPDGTTRPAAGTLSAYEPPSGPGLRVDGYGYAGYTVSPSYDSLVAKLIVHADDYPAALRRAYRALCEFRLEGVASNLPLLQNLLRLPAVASNTVSTAFVGQHLEQLLTPQAQAHPHLYFAQAAASLSITAAVIDAPPGTVALNAPNTGVLVSLSVGEGDAIATGQSVAVLEAMKMEFVVKAATSGIVRAIAAAPGATIIEGQPLLYIEPADVAGEAALSEQEHDLDHIRADLAEVLQRTAGLMDAARPDAVEKRRKRKQRTARENIDDLCDPGSFSEYGGFALAAQRRTQTVSTLIKTSPADGLVCGTATVNAAHFGAGQARALVMAYDFTVFAGTQGLTNHRKLDRMLGLAAQWRLPVVLFAEGGGGRPNDTDLNVVGGLDTPSFKNYAALSGVAPLVGIVSGRCFAGNAALLGCSDVIIATEDSNIGMGGPAMIEGGGLGSFRPEEVGPIAVQSANGVIDIRVADEAAAVAAAKQYLGYFQGPLKDWSAADQRLLRQRIPENRRQAYEVRSVIETLADTGSVLELRREFGLGVVTALIRIEGRPMGVVASNPRHLGGAIDAPASDKMARFLQLCETYRLPIVSLCDTPGFMVGPDSEKTAMVRHASRLFVIGASLTVPFMTVVLRKGYGLGAQAMTGGHFHSPLFTVAWPTGEFGAMGLEGAVRLGLAKQLEAIKDPEAREKMFKQAVAALYERGKALSTASYLEIDNVIDPADTRKWLLRGLSSMPAPELREGNKRSYIDPW
jgi:acetyl/propionyl-CoA carboxylase alpha subunit/acetyl-CoA carboxylase carboxyltransferase component